MTVEVDTPHGVKSGYSVHQLKIRRQPRVTPEAGGWSLDLEGEAAPVDLGLGRTLYVLLRMASGNFAWELLRHSFGWGTDEEDLPAHLEKARRSGREIPLDPWAYPLMVWFEDADDPQSVRIVSPDEMASVFGPGTRLQRITVVMTNEPVTHQVRKRLPWLGRFPEQRLKQTIDSYDNSPVSLLEQGDLVRGAQ